MTASITASMLYSLVTCPHRVTMDLYADPALRDEVSPFVQLLWDRGAAHEKQIVSEIGRPFVDLSAFAGDDKERLTLEAMDAGASLIYSGRLTHGDLVGEPDLLRKEAGGYVAGDIKSGSGEEGGDEDSGGKPKKAYAVQLGLYTDTLESLGRSAGRRGFIWDVRGDETIYDFMTPYGVRSPKLLWDDYHEALEQARAIIVSSDATLPAYSAGNCKNCVWYHACISRLEESNDLTLIPELGRTKRDVLIGEVRTIRELAEINPAGFVTGKKTIFPGIGPDTLEKLHARAKLISTPNAQPYLRAPISLPVMARELFFDIEVDPMRDTCYLHGFVERENGDNATEKFLGFFADDDSSGAEERAFIFAWAYMQASQPCAIYYYSKYERTWFRKLQARYPHVCSPAEIEAMFDPAHTIDLYFDVVLKATEWPTRDYSIKTLAKFLGFSWRDKHPSGAASIEWFDRYITTKDPDIRQRILDYNEDDCRATRVLLDGIRAIAHD